MDFINNKLSISFIDTPTIRTGEPETTGGLGAIDAATISKEINSVAGKRSSTYHKWSGKDRYSIGKYASENGTAATLRKFNKTYPNLTESTVRTFKKKFVDELKKADKEKREPTKVIEKYSSKTGRPLLLGELDAMVQAYLQAQSKQGCVINTSIANATARALIDRNPNLVGNIDLESSSWARSLFRRMGFVRRRKTSSKVEIPDAARKEIEFLFHHEIVSYMEQFDIPPSLILNLDQTPLKYAPVSNETMAKQGSTSVTIEGSDDKRMITGTFAITLSGKFLPPQLIYGGKTTQSIPKVSFPKEFSLSANPKHFSNTKESVKFLEEIVIPYVKDERSRLELPKEQKALMIMDAFTGQMTEDVVTQYHSNNILIVNVPKNMTKYYQPLDLTVNGYCKRYLKRRFSEWYSSQVAKQLAANVALEDVKVKLQLTTLKPLQAGWIIDFYNEMTSTKGKEIINSGWVSSGIKDAINLGLQKLPSIDPFEELDPMINDTEDVVRSNQLRMTAIACLTSEELSALGVNNDNDESDDDNEDEWVAPSEERSAFSVFDDME